MKRKLTILTFMMAVLLTGCGHEHQWKEASCETAKTCVDCGETEGEPLGHTWVEATCTEPKTCSVCGKTEGEALGHTLSEANYQSAAICSVCGETEGEPLEADFDKYGLVCNAQLDTVYLYITCCYEKPDRATTGTAVFSDYQIFTSDEEHEAKRGYVWQSVVVTSVFNDSNAQSYGARAYFCNEDYYNPVLHDDSMVKESDEKAGKYSGIYTVSFEGKEYTECKYQAAILKNGWENNKLVIQQQIAFRVPEGYDGTVVAVRDGRREWKDGEYIYDVADENTVFYRLPAAVIENQEK